MPNPLLGKQRVTSKEPPERPQAIPPEPEEYVGDNNPYRGTESHGVQSTVRPAPPSGFESTREGVTYLPREKDEEPVPVRIVQEHGREFRRWRAKVFPIAPGGATDNTPMQILPRNEARTSARIQNTGNEVLYIGDDPSVSDYTGYRLNAANPTVDLRTQDEVWCIKQPNSAVTGEIRILEEFTVEL